MTCKDCLHIEVCYMNEVCNDIDEQIKEFGCSDFADKSQYIKLPCKVGDTVYCIEFADYIGIDEGTVYAVSFMDTTWFSVRYNSGLRYDHPQNVIGKTVFLTREEAEKALEDRK